MSKLGLLFDDVAATYERANRILTFGLDRRWRRAAARMAAEGGGTRWLDICAGTGEMSEELAVRLGRGGLLVALDFNPAMMAGLGEKAAFSRRGAVVRADARRLPFPEKTFDAAVISFGVRNLNLSREILKETFAGIRAALKDGGRLVLVETSRPAFGPVRWAYFGLVRLFVRRLGKRISGSEAAYAYLARTIIGFYPADELAAVLREAGFSSVRVRSLAFGAVAVHRAVSVRAREPRLTC
jgi:demethylmenaquinone methyltransferase/2-methoxy-6-polyprenyl-1,4-benzoquinol methylase